MGASRIKGITIEIGGDTTKLQSALKDVNTEIRKTQSNLKDIDKLLKLDPGNADLLQQKYKALGTELESTKSKLNTLKDAQRQMQDAGKVNTAEYDALQREIAETEARVKSLTKEYKNFGSVSAQQVAAAGEKLKSVGGAVSDVGGKMTMGLTLPLVAVGTKAASSFAEVDKTMQLTNQTMGNTEEQAQLLSKAMKDAAANSTYGMNDAATATLNFARAGLTAEQAAASLAPSMNLAAGEGGNLDTVSAGLVATINGFHGSFDDASKYADVFAAACNNSALDVDSLSSSMSVAAPIFASAGYSVNDAALYMGIMANNGIDADKAANSLKTGIARLVSPAKEGADMMARLGISVTNADGSMKDSVTIQSELHNAFANLSESEQIAAASAIFGKNQMAPWLALINTAPGDVDALNTSLANCAGTTDQMSNAMMSGFGGSMEKLKSSIDVLVTSVGEALAPTILAVANVIQGLVDKFNALSPAQQQIIVTIGIIVAALGPILLIIGKLMIGIGMLMTYAPQIATFGASVMGIVGKVSTALKALWAVMLANPIVIVIAIIAALVAAFVYLWNTNEGFRKFWIDLWKKIVSAVKAAVEGIKNFFTRTIPDAIERLRSAIQQKWESIRNAAVNVWNAIRTIVANTIIGVRDTIGNGLSSAYQAVAKILSGIRTAFFNALSSAANIVKNAIERIRSFFNFSWSLPKLRLPHFSISGGFSINPPSVPHFSVDWYKKAMDDGMILNSPTIFGAAGGKLLGGGEAGPEAVVGVDSLRGMVQDAVAAQMGQMSQAIASAIGSMTVDAYIGSDRLGTAIIKAQQQNALIAG